MSYYNDGERQADFTCTFSDQTIPPPEERAQDDFWAPCDDEGEVSSEVSENSDSDSVEQSNEGDSQDQKPKCQRGDTECEEVVRAWEDRHGQ
jgi:hypothetical protein